MAGAQEMLRCTRQLTQMDEECVNLECQLKDVQQVPHKHHGFRQGPDNGRGSKGGVVRKP